MTIEQQNKQVSEAATKYPDRLIYFCGVDLRREEAASSKEWVEIIKSLPHESPSRYHFSEEEVSALLDDNARRLLASIPQK